MKNEELVDLADPESVSAFFVVNDDVMGGVSDSRVYHEDGALVFSGQLRLEHGGGFASMRGPIRPGADPSPLDLRDWRGLEIRIRSDGRRYKLTLRDAHTGSDGVVYRSPFETEAGTTQTLRLPFETFEAWRRGRRLENAPPLDRSALREVGVLLSDRQAGDFRIELRAIRAFR